MRQIAVANVYWFDEHFIDLVFAVLFSHSFDELLHIIFLSQKIFEWIKDYIIIYV